MDLPALRMLTKLLLNSLASLLGFFLEAFSECFVGENELHSSFIVLGRGHFTFATVAAKTNFCASNVDHFSGLHFTTTERAAFLGVLLRRYQLVIRSLCKFLGIRCKLASATTTAKVDLCIF